MLEKIKKNKENILIILLLLLGFSLRIYLFGSIPAGHNQDESMASINAQSLLHTGNDIYGNSYTPILEAWGVAPMNSLMSYLMIPFIYFFGASLFVIRLPVLITSILSLPCIYFLGKDLKNKQFGIILLFLTTISPWHIIQSRWALEANMFPHILLFAFYFLVKVDKNKINAYISMIFFALSMYCYGISYYSIPLILIFASIILFKNKLVKTKDIIICIIIYVFISLPIILTVLNNAFKLGDFNLLGITIPYLSDNKRNSDILFLSENLPLQLIRNLLHTVYMVFLQAFDSHVNSVPGFGRTYIISTIFLVIGIITNKKNVFKDNSYKTKLMSVWFIFAFISGLITNHVNVNRINIIFYPVLIFTSYGLYLLFKKSKMTFKIIIFIYMLFLFTFSLFYFGDFYKLEKLHFFDLDNCIKYIEENLSGETIYVDTFFIADNKGFINSTEVIQRDVLEYYNPKSEIKNTYKYLDIGDEFIKNSKDCYLAVFLTDNISISLDDYDYILFDRLLLIKK